VRVAQHRAPSLRLTVVRIPLSCQVVAAMPEGCQVGGSGVAEGLGKLRVYHSVRLGLPRPGGCREATTTGSISGAAWSVPFAGGGEWCRQRAQFSYRLGGGVGRVDPAHLPDARARRLPAGPRRPAGRAAAPRQRRQRRRPLDDLQRRLCVDPARIAAAGFSARMACDLAGRVASVALVSDALYTEPGGCRPSRPVPLLDIHGTDDVVVPYRGRQPTVEWPLPMPPMPTWLGEWATRDGCPGDPAVFLDRPEVTGVRWSGCRDGAEVVHYRMNGGDHRAPRSIAGRPFAQVVWGFFAAHPLGG
jgi:hypothetical protein